MEANGEMMICNECGMDKENIEYWDNHQTMSDGHIWCATKSIVDKAKLQVKSRYGNRKRHRQ